MKTVAGLVPWAIVLAAVGGGIWWLLARGMSIGPWLLAALLVGHGLVHVLFAVPSPSTTPGGPEWPFDLTRAWAATGLGLDPAIVRVVGVALVAVVVATFTLAALSTVGIVAPGDWWPAIVGVAATASAVLLVLFFEPQLLLGIGIDGVLIGVVATRAWAP